MGSMILGTTEIVEKGQLRLFEPDRFFFSITDDRMTPASEVVILANDRCDQENLIAQLIRVPFAPRQPGELDATLVEPPPCTLGVAPPGRHVPAPRPLRAEQRPPSGR